MILVAILDRYEDGPGFRQDNSAAELGLGESDVEIAIDSHDFTGTLHFRSQDRVGAGEAWISELSDDELAALVTLDHAQVEVDA